MFNQVQDLPETLTAGKEREYLNFIFDHWAYRRDRVAAQTYIDAYSSRADCVRVCLLPGYSADHRAE